MKKFAALLLAITGLNAIIAGALFILKPTGELMGMTTAYLAPSPFASFFIPGLILFSIIGLGNLLSFILILKNHRYSAVLCMSQGILLSGWILIQMILVRDCNFLHIIMLIIGFALMAAGLRLKTERSG